MVKGQKGCSYFAPVPSPLLNDGLPMLKRRVLVLNQNYEPLGVCTAKRAIILIFLGKAEIVEEDGRFIHSVSLVYPLPSVVRLIFFISRHNRRVVLSRRNILKRDGFRCQYCGSTNKSLTVDHIIPRRLGGKDVWENLCCACTDCNNKKGNRSPEEAKMKLLKLPSRPTYITYIQHFIGVSDLKWRPYLFLS